LLLLPEYATTGWFILGKTVLIVAVLLTLWSMVVYLRSFFSVIRESEGQ
jgi:amino acid permease